MRGRKGKAVVVSLGLLVAMVGGSQAEQLVKLPPEWALTRGVMDVGETSMNVALGQMTVDDLPKEIADQVKSSLLTCTTGLKHLKDVHVYSWISDWNRQQELAPNYVVDFNGVMDPPEEAAAAAPPAAPTDSVDLFAAMSTIPVYESKKVDPEAVSPVAPNIQPGNCAEGALCDKEGCFLKGFAPQKTGRWRQDFEVKQTSFRFFSYKDEAGTLQTILELFSVKPDCVKEGGSLIKKGKVCLRQFLWRSYGLSVLGG